MLKMSIFQGFILTVFVSFTTARQHRYSKVDSQSVRYSDITGQYFNTSRIPCLALCDGKDGCLSVNHNLGTDICELSAHIPRVLTPLSVTEPNWRAYYHDRFIRAVGAWQSSTFVEPYATISSLTADFAIDGNYENSYLETGLPCAHAATGYSYWAMEFEHIAEVSYIIVYFRDDNNHRNTNLRLLISGTRQDSDGNVGTDCATYVGPPTSPALPVTVKCVQSAMGKFLKIIDLTEGLLTLCEVEVYSI